MKPVICVCVAVLVCLTVVAQVITFVLRKAFQVGLTIVFEVFQLSQHEQPAVKGAQADIYTPVFECPTDSFYLTVAITNVVVLAVLIYYVLWLKWITQELNPFLLPFKGYEDEYEYSESLSIDHMRKLANIPILDLNQGTCTRSSYIHVAEYYTMIDLFNNKYNNNNNFIEHTNIGVQNYIHTYIHNIILSNYYLYKHHISKLHFFNTI